MLPDPARGGLDHFPRVEWKVYLMIPPPEEIAWDRGRVHAQWINFRSFDSAIACERYRLLAIEAQDAEVKRAFDEASAKGDLFGPTEPERVPAWLAGNSPSRRLASSTDWLLALRASRCVSSDDPRLR